MTRHEHLGFIIHLTRRGRVGCTFLMTRIQSMCLNDFLTRKIYISKMTRNHTVGFSHFVTRNRKLDFMSNLTRLP